MTLLGHRALGERLRTYFIDTGLMRQGEPEWVVGLFARLGVKVELVPAQAEFFTALRGLTDPEAKREAITQTFYRKVFGRLVRESGARFLLHGTNYTDVEETVAGVKRQHNILEQLGIDTQKEFGYKVLEPLVQLRKTGVRMVARGARSAQRDHRASTLSRSGAGSEGDRRGDTGADCARPAGDCDR